MDPNKILSSSLLDLVFENRNKEYGAYDLRKTYPKRIILALVIMASVGLLLVGGSILANKLDDGKGKKVKIEEVTMTKIEPEPEEKKPPPPPPPPPPPKAPEPPKIEMKQFTPPKIVEDQKVIEPPPAQEDLKEVKIDIKSQAGIKDVGLVLPPAGVDEGKGVLEVKKAVVEDNDKPFEKVEIEATFPGGSAAWTKYLTNKLDGDTPADNGAPPGTYKVLIRFVVDKTGAISDVKALTNLGYGMEQEAIKVIKNGPNWIPAEQNGRMVTAFRTQPITFQVQENEF